MSLAVLGLIGTGAHAVFTTSTTSSQTITAGTWGAPPTVAITYPVNNTTYGSNWTGSITGTASSNSGSGTSITAVSVAIEDTATGQWWNGTSFSATAQTFVTASGTTNWSLALAGSSLSTGDAYSVVAQATDSLGYVGTSSTVSFTYCLKTSPPTVIITYPVNNTTYGTNWGGAITGTASAGAGATISKVKVSIQQVGGSCWTGSGDTYTATCPNYVAVTSGTTNWSLTVPNSDLTSGDSYSVTAQATDSYANVATSSTVSFTYGTALPMVTITYPVNGTDLCACGYTGKITGTASSNSGSGTSITAVSVAIENTTTGKWWNGTSFSASSQSFVAASGTTSWALALAGSSLSTGDSYSVVAEATDSLGNVGSSSTVSFTYCLKASPPTVTITYPVNKTTYGTNWTGEITGTASAGAGATITKTSVAVENNTTSKWWNGTSFSASSQSFVTATGTTGWSLPLGAGSLTSGDNYSIIAEATDSLGNPGTSPTVRFIYNSSPPTVAITYPVNNTTYGTNWTGTITGTASSNSGPGTSITGVAVAVENTTTSQWWNGTSFSASSQSFVTASGTTGWSLALAASSLTSGDAYSVIAQATDSVGNVGTSPTVTFTYNCSPPTVTITYPVTGTTYGSTYWGGAITGTAASNAGAGTTITGVSVAIENTTTGKWWNGTSFSATSPTSVAASGTTSWSRRLLVKYLASGDSYSVTAQATDSLKNVGTSSTVTFSYGTCSHG
jgi:ribosomal protein S12 methylthiotransferase accessory factor YcaO